MRVQLDNGRKQVDLEFEYGAEKFLYIVKKALEAMDYTQADLLREWSSEPTQEVGGAPVANNTFLSPANEPPTIS